MGLLDFLFGKDPDIFDEKGEVRHKLPEEKWRRWKERFSNNPDFDWRQHAGKKPPEAKIEKLAKEKNQDKHQ